MVSHYVGLGDTAGLARVSPMLKWLGRRDLLPTSLAATSLADAPSRSSERVLEQRGTEHVVTMRGLDCHDADTYYDVTDRSESLSDGDYGLPRVPTWAELQHVLLEDWYYRTSARYWQIDPTGPRDERTGWRSLLMFVGSPI